MGLLSPTSRNRARLRLAPYDLACAIAAPFVALALRDPGLLDLGGSDGFPGPYLFVLITLICALPSFLAFRLSDGMSRYFSVHDLMAICAAVATTIASTSVFLFVFTRLDGIPRSTPLIYAMVLGGLLVVGRAFHRVVITEENRTLTPRADQLRNVVIIGADRFAALATKLIGAQTPRTTRVVAFLDDRPQMAGRTVNGVRIVGSAHDLDSIIDEYVVHGVEIDQVLLSEGASDLSETAIEALQEICENRSIAMLSLSEAFNLTPKAASCAAADAKLAAPTIEIPSYFTLKRIFDVAASVCLLLALSPITLVVSALALIDVGTPILFWQERIGQGGRRFLLYKFRTYRAPYDWRGRPIAEHDRLSRVGRFMRRSRFDEIPQLMNILVGDMSLIGPRPLLPKDQPEDTSIRLLARPGITGWAQVNGGNLVTPDEKEALDAWYIQHASLWIDVKILIHSLIIAATGERFNRQAIEEALDWRSNASNARAGDVEQAIAKLN
jgi:lipopolysaccharide/colanic/teichoic acid biosynthesis glycosyltransferase